MPHLTGGTLTSVQTTRGGHGGHLRRVLGPKTAVAKTMESLELHDKNFRKNMKKKLKTCRSPVAFAVSILNALVRFLYLFCIVLKPGVYLL